VPLDLARRLGELGPDRRWTGRLRVSADEPPLAAGVDHHGAQTAVDGSLGTFLGVQGRSWRCARSTCTASEEQKQRWLPAMGAPAKKLGAFAPDRAGPRLGFGLARDRRARREGDEYVIKRARKRWIGNGSMADVRGAVGRGADVEDMQVKGFLIEKGTPGYDGRPDTG